jgi:hypothetical protein
MNDEDELIMWSLLRVQLVAVPNDVRSQNFTAFYQEIEARSYRRHHHQARTKNSGLAKEFINGRCRSHQ